MPRSNKEQFLDALEREHQRTMRVLRAYPDDQSDFKPHERSNSAVNVAWPLAAGLERLMLKALTTGFDWSKPSPPPTKPTRVSEVAAALDEAVVKVMDALRAADDAKLDGTIQFFVAPKTLGDYKVMDFLWFLLFDHIHHRGQLSVYLRMVDKVPSIYGPSGDEPWN